MAAILDAEDHTSLVSDSLIRDLHDMLVQPEGKPVTELLATLIASGCLSIRIAYRPGAAGIFHLKRGVFYDHLGNSISVVGSDNETFMAWDEAGNYEGFAVFLSWAEGLRERQRVVNHAEYFERLWSGTEKGLRVVPLPQVPAELLGNHVNPDGVQAAIENARAYLQKVRSRPTADRRKPQAHQRAALEAWWKERRGIIDHVTGAGKTYTALCILRSWFGEGNRSAIILVPSELLASQWSREIDQHLDDVDVRKLRVGGDDSNRDWRRLLRSYTDPSNPRGANVVIATMQSACKVEFIERARSGKHLLLIADEVHKTGSREHRKILAIDAGGRLGLSATPERYLDPEGTRAITDYFGDVIPPPFGIRDAQAAGRLVQYDYDITLATLAPNELEEYEQLTQRVARARAAAAQEDDNSGLRALLVARARVLKKAEAKVMIAERIIRLHYKMDAGQRWLVYCDDTPQLRSVMALLANQGIECQEYTSAMAAAKKETIEIFERFGGVLCSIHCLDEGVDIPSITHALLLASSINPREHLQRRGRVLRRADRKHSAKIFDVLVATDEQGERRVFRTELLRARRIAEDARNQRTVTFEIDNLLVRSRPDDGMDFEED